MGYYSDKELPALYFLASTFATADHYFSSLLGPTQPNRAFLYAATSFGRTSNKIIGTDTQNLFEALAAKEISWHVYSKSLPAPAILAATYGKWIERYSKYPEFLTAAAAGTLDHVVFVDADLADKNA